MQHNFDMHSWLSSKAASFASWIAAGLGLSSALGWVQLTVGILSGAWLIVQWWNYFTYTLPLNKAKLASVNSSKKDTCDVTN